MVSIAPLALCFVLCAAWIATRSGSRDCAPNDYSCKVDVALASIDARQSLQSTTERQAIGEYRRRYKREPPRGFAQWLKLAFDQQAVLVDEYGQIEADLLPFRALSPAELRRRMRSALEANERVTERRRLGVLRVASGRLSVEGYSFVEISNATLYDMIEPIAHLLPDLEVLVNWFPQPRVLGAETGPHSALSNVVFNDISSKDNWDTLRAACPSKYIVSNRDELDICTWTDDQRKHHGIFVASPSLIVTDSLVPIISRGKLSTMRDILAPNPCYWADRYRLWTAPDEVPFEEKAWSVYWKGQTTGSVLTQATLFASHRMRFSALITWISRSLAVRDDHDGDALQQWRLAESVRVASGLPLHDLASLSRLRSSSFDVSFDRIFAVDDAQTEADVQRHYPFGPRDHPTEMYRHQFVPDLDGESMSCRFYAQLASGSVPLKQTLFAEWHDERIVAWAHYIPIASSYDDVPALLAWLSTPQGQRSAAKVSRAGQRLARQALRRSDLTLYYHRLLLEYASLFHRR